MSDEETLSLSAAWMSGPPASQQHVMSTIGSVLDIDRKARERERRGRVGLVLALALLIPAMLWGAAYGVAPLVRGAYALLAVGSAMIVAAEWLYLEWSRQALPGPADARSQLQTTAFMLGRQVMLMKTAPVWSAPVFIGVALIGAWLYRDRTPVAAVALWATVVAGWLLAVLGTMSVRAKLDARRRQVERLLGELSELPATDQDW
jgi:hypothetical protein